MSRALRVNGTMDEELLRRMDAYAEQQHYEDRSTALRQLVDFALRELQKRETLDAYRSGRVTLRDFGRALGLTTWQAHDLLRAEGVAVARGDRTETAQALEAVLQDLPQDRPTVMYGALFRRLPQRPDRLFVESALRRWRNIRRAVFVCAHRPAKLPGQGGDRAALPQRAVSAVTGCLRGRPSQVKGAFGVAARWRTRHPGPLDLRASTAPRAPPKSPADLNR